MITAREQTVCYASKWMENYPTVNKIMLGTRVSEHNVQEEKSILVRQAKQDILELNNILITTESQLLEEWLASIYGHLREGYLSVPSKEVGNDPT